MPTIRDILDNPRVNRLGETLREALTGPKGPVMEFPMREDPGTQAILHDVSRSQQATKKHQSKFTGGNRELEAVLSMGDWEYPADMPQEGWMGFPTKHPVHRFRDAEGNSTGENVRMMSVGFSKDGPTFAVPTFVDGKQLTNEEAIALAKRHGLMSYPMFDTVEGAESWIQSNHGRIDAFGEWRRPEVGYSRKRDHIERK